ncbi:hypothetical protein Nepgr_032966 [Nepenthes gracilis]|uniref:Peroxidase n=1 Tax=Nepenthes gracilis TaxID=150966 RepID=A0AAD3Y6I8_NEPGR|nr:hypothetical protein Nepgr_032966 [Nepenthes gracilis]
MMAMAVALFCIIISSIAASNDGKQLRDEFYGTSCPQAEKIVHDVVRKNEFSNKGVAPGLIRLLFHDCFITGCDASVLLKPSPENQTEMAHPANGDSLRGLEVIDEAKAKVEKHCPGVVSCADILAFAARDAAVLSGNPRYAVPAGRRDGLSSKKEDAGALPASRWTVSQMTEAFANKGLNQEDLVALLGSHSIGISRCFNTIANEDFVNVVPGVRSILDERFERVVKEKYCPELMKGTAPFNIDSELSLSLKSFIWKIERHDDFNWGISFYRNILKGEGLLPSDVGLVADNNTREIVDRFAANATMWASHFRDAMIRLGNLDVLTGEEGEIRKVCGYVN